MNLSRRVVFFICALALAGCADNGPPPEPRDKPAPFHPPIEILLRYDANHDGILTRAEMEAGLKADFATADTDHDGRLDEDETRAVNEKRWSENASTTSTLVDWNQDGYVDFNEFAGTARSLFAELDRDGNGYLGAQEIDPKAQKKKAGGPEHHP